MCFSYICIRLTYLLVKKIYRCVVCYRVDLKKKPLRHIYHNSDMSFSSSAARNTIEYRYVYHLFQKTIRLLIQKPRKISFVKVLLFKIYRPSKYFCYSKQILNMYMLAFMITYYLTFNILHGSFYLIEKIYGVFIIPLWMTFDDLKFPEPNPFNLKYEIVFSCVF